FQQIVSGCGDRVRRVVDVDDPVVVAVDPVAAFRSVLHRLDRLTTPAVARSGIIEGTELHRSGSPPVVVSLRDAGAVPTPMVCLDFAVTCESINLIPSVYLSHYV